MIVRQNIVVTHNHQTFDNIETLFLELRVQTVALAPIERARSAGHDRGDKQYGEEGEFCLKVQWKMVSSLR